MHVHIQRLCNISTNLEMSVLKWGKKMKERNEMGVCGLKSSQDVQLQNHENLMEDTDGIIRDTSVITYTVQNLKHKYKTPLHHLHFSGDKIGRKIP